MNVIRHGAVTLLALALLLGLPAAADPALAGALRGDPDAVSGATAVLPAQPSGTFLLLLNEARHPATAAQWRDFLAGVPGEVIMDDVHCLAAAGDEAGVQLARRFQARLAEHQMTLRVENGVLAASRAEAGEFDLLVLSAEAAALYGLSDDPAIPGVTAVTVRGDGT